jgi:hypothetical protein
MYTFMLTRLRVNYSINSTKSRKKRSNKRARLVYWIDMEAKNIWRKCQKNFWEVKLRTMSNIPVVGKSSKEGSQ